MVINPSLDIWVWVTCLVLLAVLGARAWVVETGQGRLGRTPVRVQVLTGAVGVVLVVLFGLLAMQGGILLVDSILTGTDPAQVVYGPDADQGGGDQGGGDQGAADPGTADPGAADPNAPAPPAGQAPAAPPAAGRPGG